MQKPGKIIVNLPKKEKEKRILKSLISSFRIEKIDISEKEANEALKKVEMRIKKPYLVLARKNFSKLEQFIGKN